MTQTKLALLTWVEVAEYLKTKDSLLLPIGSTEQHGPTGLLGTDYLTATAIAEKVAAELGILVAPPLCYGMAAHHMSFSGSVSLRPSVYQAVLVEILKSYYAHGFRRFFLVNGHGGNEFSARAVFQELKADGLTGASFALYNWWKMPPVAALAEKLYGKKEGFHATPSEVSLTFFLHGIESRPYTPPRDQSADTTWPLTSDEIRNVFPDGTMRSDPGLARGEHGRQFFDIAVQAVRAEVEKA